MSEDMTKAMNSDSTNPLPFEELVKRQFEALFRQLNQMEANRQAEIADLREEIKARFVQLSGEVRAVEEQLGKVEIRLDKVETQLDKVEARLGKVEDKLDEVDKRVKSLDRKVGPFIKEQIDLKYELEELKESLRPQNGSTVNTV